MAESIVLVTQPRTGHGSQAARKLRRQGLIPAVVYGHKKETVPIALNGEEFLNAIHHGARVVDLKSDAATEHALIQELQWDHLGKDVLHVDFRRVDIHERVQVPVPLEIRGIAPGVTAGGTLDQPLHSVIVECPVNAVPDNIRVNIGELQVGQAIHVRDLHLPPEAKVLADPDAIVVHVKEPQVAPEAAAVPGVAETAEPEVIGRKAAEEEEEEKKK
jgi:large subunit ribosomal protein L25